MPLSIDLQTPDLAWTHLGDVHVDSPPGTMRDISEDGTATYVMFECLDLDAGAAIFRVHDPDIEATTGDRQIRILAFDSENATLIAKLAPGESFDLPIRNSAALPLMLVRFQHSQGVREAPDREAMML